MATGKKSTSSGKGVWGGKSAGGSKTELSKTALVNPANDAMCNKFYGNNCTKPPQAKCACTQTTTGD